MEASPQPDAKREPVHVLVVSNESVGGHKLLEAVERRAAAGPIRCTVVCPQDVPHQGFVIYDALYAWLREARDETHSWNPQRRTA